MFTWWTIACHLGIVVIIDLTAVYPCGATHYFYAAFGAHISAEATSLAVVLIDQQTLVQFPSLSLAKRFRKHSTPLLLQVVDAAKNGGFLLILLSFNGFRLQRETLEDFFSLLLISPLSEVHLHRKLVMPGLVESSGYAHVRLFIV